MKLSKVESAEARDCWTMVHYSYFKGFGLEWPPALSDYCLDGIRAREAEVVHLCNAVWEMKTDREFLDVNP